MIVAHSVEANVITYHVLGRPVGKSLIKYRALFFWRYKLSRPRRIWTILVFNKNYIPLSCTLDYIGLYANIMNLVFNLLFFFSQICFWCNCDCIVVVFLFCLYWFSCTLCWCKLLCGFAEILKQYIGRFNSRVQVLS